MLWLIAAVALFKWRHKPVREALRWFVNYRLLTFSTLLSIMFLVAGGLMSDFTHFTVILIAGGTISSVLCAAILAPPKGQVVTEGKKQVVKETARKIKFFWLFLGMIVGVFALFGAYILFPAITTQEGVITFIILMLVGLTFLVRAVPAMNFPVYVPVAIAYWTATNAPTWIRPFNVAGNTVILGDPAVLLITIVLTIAVFLISVVLLLWLSHATNFTGKILNSPPFLFLTALICLTWASLLVVFQWSL
jgi:hypothetical protein